MDGYNLVLTSSVGLIRDSIRFFQHCGNSVFGIQSGKVVGSGGENAVLEGTVIFHKELPFKEPM